MMLAVHDQRRKKPSYLIPFLFEVLELIMIWTVFAIVEASLDITQWSLISYALALIWFFYTIHKLQKVLSRQNLHHW